MLFLCEESADFSNLILKKCSRNTFCVSKSLDPNQIGHFVWPDLSTNCLQRLSAQQKLFTVFHKNSMLSCKHYLGLVVTKPVFGVSDKASFKPVSSATETS